MIATFDLQRQSFLGLPCPDVQVRRQWLLALRKMLLNNRQALAEAVDRDFNGRSHDETLMAEVFPSLQGIDHARRHLARWMKPRRRHVDLAFLPGSARIEPQPLGVIGIVVPWNYPILLAIAPLCAALAAGNRVMLKLSESTPETGQLLARLIADTFPEDLVSVVLGDAPVAEAFTRLPFDHLLFTGSTAIGRRVMAAASENLTPVTLELGGKSPVILDQHYPMEIAAERIALGKLLNAGQTCVAPDYLLIPRSRVEAFTRAFRQAVINLYPSLASRDYSAIIDTRQLQRLEALMSDALAKGARMLPCHPDEARPGSLVPHLLLEVNSQMRVMQEEIFGPLLPVVPYDDLDQALAHINAGPRPLALYFFGNNRTQRRRVLEATRSGGVCFNDTLLHAAQEDLPFGGVGASGMGHYHGREGFETFSKLRPILSRGRINPARLFYPPYNKRIQNWLRKWLLR